jgi:hypothetical protein
LARITSFSMGLLAVTVAPFTAQARLETTGID